MDSQRALLDRYAELYNARDLDGCVELFAEDAVQVSPDGTVVGRSRIRERLARQLAACPDMRLTVGSFVEHGDVFADEWSFAGTHTGPFLLPDGTELPPTGKPVEIKGMELVQVRDAKIVNRHLYYDYLTVAAQLGLLPQPATTS
jgi:steroid delta-isomerase-like uncharacterized protein